MRLRFFFMLVGVSFCALAMTVLQHRAGSLRSAAAPQASFVENRAPSAMGPALPSACDHLYEAICGKAESSPHDFTGSVNADSYGELKALHLYEDIVAAHHDWTREQLDEELVTEIYSPKRVAHFQSAYRWVQKAIERWIDSQPEVTFNKHEKRILKQRIRKTQLQLPPPASTYSDEPDLYTKDDIFYERVSDGTMRMRVGGAYLLSVKSWFNMVFTLGHELGHSIDPCELRSIQMRIPSYDRLSACFLERGIVPARKTREECGHDDLLSETFADWLAVQITAEALKMYAYEFHGQQLYYAATNSVRDLCEQDETELDNAEHPTPRVRIDGIFGQNPTMRELLGCSAESNKGAYCEF